jgi:hypothetical protein
MTKNTWVAVGILALCGLAGGLIALGLVDGARGVSLVDRDPASRDSATGQHIVLTRSPSTGTVHSTWAVALDPATGRFSWKGADLDQNGAVTGGGYGYLSPDVYPVPWPAGVPLRIAVPVGIGLGFLFGSAALFLLRLSRRRLRRG